MNARLPSLAVITTLAVTALAVPASRPFDAQPERQDLTSRIRDLEIVVLRQDEALNESLKQLGHLQRVTDALVAA